MSIYHISFSFKARYAALGTIEKTNTNIWFVLHGYGQLAPYFIKKFEPIADSNTLIIAPEGLSRFYLEDVTKRVATGNNRVGATWMTREERLTDIENYLHYLNSLYQHVKKFSPNAAVSLLGFSQGAATATRWAQQNPQYFKRLLLWAGILPEDLTLSGNNQEFKSLPLHIVYGANDPFLTDERLMQHQNIEARIGLKAEVTTFNGGHEIDKETLLKFK
jgi:predicted esterase